MGKTKIIVLLAILSSGMVSAQEDIYVRPGLITATSTISPSFMLNRKEVNYYVTGFFDVRIDKNLSFRGETHYLTGSNKDTPYFRNNSRTHFGVQYHKSVKNFDSYIGFMPGFSVLQLTDDRSIGNEQMTRFVPGFTANIGVTYYVWKYFNFFANFTYHNTTVRGVTQTNNRADEFMISAGLGFNINAVKEKK